MPKRRSRSRKKPSKSSHLENQDGAVHSVQKGQHYFDLNVPLLFDYGIRNNHEDNTKMKKRKRASAEEQSKLIDRLERTGYSTVALSHSIEGSNIQHEKDMSTKTIPSFLRSTNVKGKGSDSSSKKKKIAGNEKVNIQKKFEGDDSSWKESPKADFEKNRSSKILSRLNVCIHEPSELAMYCNNAPTKSIEKVLKSYDLIAMSPKNDESFSSICNMSTLFYVDIITLDYTLGRGGIQLPYRLKSSDISAAVHQGLVFEIPYGPALTDISKRKAFVQTARLFLNACIGVKGIDGGKPKLILSSGDRTREKKDYGVMALRSPRDLVNFAQVVLGLDDKLSSDALGSSAAFAVRRGYNRSVGKVASSKAGLTFEVMLNEDESQLQPNERKITLENVSPKGEANVSDEREFVGDKKEEKAFDPEDDFLQF